MLIPLTFSAILPIPPLLTPVARSSASRPPLPLRFPLLRSSTPSDSEIDRQAYVSDGWRIAHQRQVRKQQLDECGVCVFGGKVKVTVLENAAVEYRRPELGNQ